MMMVVMMNLVWAHSAQVSCIMSKRLEIC